MRTLGRNKTKIYYSLFEGEEEIMVDGDPTGESVPSYSDPVALWCNVSASRGVADSELFGINLDYSRTLCIRDTDCPIDEESILWIGRSPKNGDKHNYVVRAVAKSLNNTVIAVKEVRVS